LKNNILIAVLLFFIIVRSRFLFRFHHSKHSHSYGCSIGAIARGVVDLVSTPAWGVGEKEWEEGR